MTDEPTEAPPSPQAPASKPPSSDPQFHRMDCYVFTAEGHTQDCLLPVGHKFVEVMRGSAPRVLEAEGGDDFCYEMEAPAARDGTQYPVILMVVREAHLRAICNMTQDLIAELVARIEGRAVKGH